MRVGRFLLTFSLSSQLGDTGDTFAMFLILREVADIRDIKFEGPELHMRIEPIRQKINKTNLNLVFRLEKIKMNKAKWDLGLAVLYSMTSYQALPNVSYECAFWSCHLYRCYAL